MKNAVFVNVFVFVCILGISLVPLFADIKQAELPSVLDITSAQGVEFLTDAKGCTAVEKYTNDHIAQDAWADKPTKGTVRPVNGSKFMQMKGSESPVTGPRSARIKASFTFQVFGAGTLSFSTRAATWGEYDDVLVFYEDDIDDAIFERSSECWYKVETWEGEKYYDLDEESFWNDEEITFYSDKYTRKVNVALLAPEKDEYYEKPDTEDYVVPYLAWLDNFVWTPSDTAILCEFIPASGSQFGEAGGTVYLETDYTFSEGESHQSILTFYYTTDGTKPSRASRVYDDDEGISITEDTIVKVVAYEGTKMVAENLSAEYTLRLAPEAPVCTVESQEPFSSEATVTFRLPNTALPLKFYYTLDGSDPTEESEEGDACVVNGPCTLKVRACDDGTLGEISTFDFKCVQAPTIVCEADGYATSNPIFDENISVSLVPNSLGNAVFYQVGAGNVEEFSSPLNFTASVQLQAVEVSPKDIQLENGETGLLNSEVAAFELQKTEAGNGDWLTEQLTEEGWNIVGVKRDISESTGRKLAEWLKPYGYDKNRKVFELATVMEAGRSYMVYNDVGAAPAVVQSLLRTEEAVPTKEWDLLDGKASYRFRNGRFEAVDPAEDYPGWSKSQE